MGIKRNIQYPYRMIYLEVVPLLVMTILFTLMVWLPMIWEHKVLLSLGVLLFIIAYSYGVYSLGFRKWAAKEKENRLSSLKYTIPSPYEDKEDKLHLYLSILGSIVLPSSIVFSIIILYLNDKIGLAIPAWILIIAVAGWMYYVYRIFQGLGYPKISVFSPDDSDNYQPRYKLTKQLDRALRRLEITSADLLSQEREVEALSIPQPLAVSSAAISPFVDYVKDIGNIKKSHPQMASLEQLVLSVTHFDNIEGWEDSLRDSIGAGAHLTSSSEQYVVDTIKNFSDFIKSPDKGTWVELLHNIGDRIHDSAGSKLLRLKLSHAHSLSGYLSTLGKEAGKNLGLGTYDTFSSEDAMSHIKDNLDNYIHSLEDFGEHFIPTVDLSEINVFEPDFDFSAHFPLISTLKETFTNISRAADGNVDMVSSLWHSTTKIAGKAGGAYLGAAIGSILLPGAGTIIGGMLGAMAGSWGANKYNAQKFEALKEEYEAEYSKLQSVVASAKNVIENKQTLVGANITNEAQAQQNVFESAKGNGSFSSWANSHSLSMYDIATYSYGYIVYNLIWETAIQYSAKLKNYNPEKYRMLINLLPASKHDMDNFVFNESTSGIHKYKCGSRESLLSMIDGYIKLVKEEIVHAPKYFDIEEMCRMFIGMIESQILTMHAQHIGWLNSVQQSYVVCTNKVLRKSESEFDELQTVIENQQTTIKNQSDICADIANRAEQERKTL